MVSGEGRTQALFERWDFLETVYHLLIVGFVFTSRSLGENWRARSDKFLIDNRNYPPVLTYYGVWEWALQNGTLFLFVLIKILHCSSLTDQAASSLQSWLLCCCKCWDNNILCCGHRRVEFLSPQKPNTLKTWGLPEWPGSSWRLTQPESSHLVHSVLFPFLFFSPKC